ncbi:hypothetical protein RA993_23355, partial [Mycobacteroides abscessus subsp. abscessus]
MSIAKLIRCVAVALVVMLASPVGIAAAIEAPVVPAGPPPADPEPDPGRPMHQVEDCTKTVLTNTVDPREL